MQQYPKPKNFARRCLAVAVIGLLAEQAWAADSTTEEEEPTVNLGTIVVNIQSGQPTQVGETVLKRDELNRQMIQSSHDLVRYNNEVDVAEVGRYGNKGFAIRGVDGNRVAMAIDGVSLPEVEVNELYSPYGYTYEGRFSPDIEMMGSVRIHAGADSINSGSGAVGGSINYQTKMPSMLVRGDNKLGGYAKVGYTNKNDELMTAVGLAGVSDKIEFLVNYAHRKGHELKNHDMRSHDPERLNNVNYNFRAKGEFGRPSDPTSALYPDSAAYTRHATLAKLYYNLSDEHRLGAHALHQRQVSRSFAISKGTGSGLRKTADVEEMQAFGVNYRYSPSANTWLNELKLGYTYQDIFGLANTDLHSSWSGNLSLGEYRPTQTKTHQLKAETLFRPIDLGRLGEHQLRLTGVYNKQDYTSNKIALDFNSRTGQINNAFQPNIIPFPDAKKDIWSIALSDDIYFNSRFNATLGVRYDHLKYAPYFEDKIYFGNPLTSEINEILKNLPRSQIGFYQDYRNGVYNQTPKFSRFTYSGLFEYDLIPDRLTARYKVGTGFLAPTVTQIYSAFSGLGVEQIINPDLKPETSLNNEIEFELNIDPVTLTASAYQTDYKNFIHTQWWDRFDVRNRSRNCTLQYTCLQSINLDDAKIQGYKVGLRADLSRWVGSDKMYFTADYHTAKDEATYVADQPQDGVLKINTLASVPTTTTFGIDYLTGDDKFSVSFKGRYIEGKAPDDTKMVAVVSDRGRASGYREQATAYRFAHKSQDALLFDVYGSYKLNNNLKLQAGIYNLTDEKYIPWETLRQFAITNINNFMDRDGYGFNRYTAPGRNYALSLTYEF